MAGGVSLLAMNVFQNNTAGGYGGAVAYEDQCFTVYDTSGAGSGTLKVLILFHKLFVHY